MTFKKPKLKSILIGSMTILVLAIAGSFWADRATAASDNDANGEGLHALPPTTVFRKFGVNDIGIDFKAKSDSSANFFRVLEDKDGPVDEAGTKDSTAGTPIKATLSLAFTKPAELNMSGSGICDITCLESLGLINVNSLLSILPGVDAPEGWDNLYVDHVMPTAKALRGFGVSYSNEDPAKSCSAGTIFDTNIKSCSYQNYKYFDALSTHAPFPTYYTFVANKPGTIDLTLDKSTRSSLGINKASDEGTLNTLYLIPFLGYESYIGPSNGASYVNQTLKITVKVYANTDKGKANYLADKDKPPDVNNDTNSSGALGGSGSSLADILNEIWTYIVLLHVRIIYWLFANVVAPLIEALLQVHPYQDVFVEAIYLGWQLIRNLCNIFFIVILLVIGLGTLFRIESYNYKHLLVKVVIAALLVNFSLVFGQAILGIADTVQGQFLPDSTNVIRALGSKLMVDPINRLTDPSNFTTSAGATTAGASFANITKPTFAFALALGAFFTFCALAAFLVIRLVALWVLLLVSPLAYVANVLPQTAQYTRTWWTHFLKYAFMTPVLAFFLNLSAVFATTMLKDQSTMSKLLAASNVSSDIGQYVYLVGSQILIILFILVGLKAAHSSGTYGAAAVANFAEKGLRKPFEWAGRAAGGAAKGAGALGKMGAERGFEAVQNKVGLTLDPRILKKAGSEYFAEQKAKRLQARRGRALFGMEHGPMLGDAQSNFESYVNWRGLKRMARFAASGGKGATYYQHHAEEEEARAKAFTQEEIDERLAKEKTLKDSKFYSDKGLAVVRKEQQDRQKEIESMRTRLDDPRSAEYGDEGLAKEIKVKEKELDELEKGKLKDAEGKNDEIVKELEKIRKELEDDKESKAEFHIDTAKVTPASKEEAKKLAEDYTAKISEMKRPENYAAFAAHHHLLSDEMKKIEHIDESDRLVQLYKDAVTQGDRYKAEAVMHKLAKDTNFNELLEGIYGKNDYKTFVKHFTDSFAKDFKLNHHEALEAMSEVSYINEGNNVFNLARAIEIDKHGHMKELSEDDHNKIIETQMKKVEPQAQARSFWRGAFLDEELNDHHDVSKGKSFRLHNAGIRIITDSLSKGGGLRSVAERMQEYNRNAIKEAIDKEMKDPATAREGVKKLAANKAFMDALRYAKTPGK